MTKRAPSRPIWKSLRIGDRVRLVEYPPEFQTPGYCVHRETVRVYRRLLKRNRALRVSWIEDGQPWVLVRFRRPRGGWETHSLALNHDGIARVQPRPKEQVQAVSFQNLKVGDWIRIVAIPDKWCVPGYNFPRETRQLYERLIRVRRAVKVDHIDDWGYPWIAYRHLDKRGRHHFHMLMIGQDDLFVRVSARKRVR
jgi:hypothetical protein